MADDRHLQILKGFIFCSRADEGFADEMRTDLEHSGFESS